MLINKRDEAYAQLEEMLRKQQEAIDGIIHTTLIIAPIRYRIVAKRRVIGET